MMISCSNSVKQTKEEPEPADNGLTGFESPQKRKRVASSSSSDSSEAAPVATPVKVEETEEERKKRKKKEKKEKKRRESEAAAAAAAQEEEMEVPDASGDVSKWQKTVKAFELQLHKYWITLPLAHFVFRVHKPLPF